MIIKRRIYLDNPISYPFGISYCEDFYVACQLFYYAKEVSKVNDTLYYYNRANVSSIMHSINWKTFEDEKKTYQFIIAFIEEHGLGQRLEKVLSWRVLKNKQDLVLFPDKHEEFLNLILAQLYRTTDCFLQTVIHKKITIYNLRLCPLCLII